MDRLVYNGEVRNCLSKRSFPESSVCVIGNARTSSDNPITHTYSQFFITFVVDNSDDKIIDLEASFTLPLTNRFVRDLFLGSSMREVDEKVLESIQSRYLGSSQKAIAVAYKDAVKKYSCFVHRPDR